MPVEVETGSDEKTLVFALVVIESMLLAKVLDVGLDEMLSYHNTLHRDAETDCWMSIN